MSERHSLIAYLATLAAIVILVVIAAVLAFHGKYSEAIGIGAAITGLIGVIRLPSNRPTDADPMPTKVVNQASDAVPVEPQG